MSATRWASRTIQICSLYERCAKKSNQKSSQKSDQKILAAIRSNPTITIEELKQQTGLSESGIKKIIRQLKQSGILERVGGRKGGSWRIEN